jgi:SAM-dependent methyltransferase
MHCGAVERHRLVWIYFGTMTDLFDRPSRRMLHVAPERCLESRLKKYFRPGHYITADLLSPRAMVRMDITDIHFPDGYFDILLCSHVLEHVENDRKALREFYRVLKPGGWAILNVPVTAERTLEDPSVVTAAERLKVFGQEDHVRRYGPDYVDRLGEAGFKVRIIGVSDLVTEEEALRMGLTPASGEIFCCSKD